MTWEIGFSRQALKYLQEGIITEIQILRIIEKALLKFQGQEINIDVAKLHGTWKDSHRIRFGKLRIIATFNFDTKFVLIERVDERGNVYR